MKRTTMHKPKHPPKSEKKTERNNRNVHVALGGPREAPASFFHYIAGHFQDNRSLHSSRVGWCFPNQQSHARKSNKTNLCACGFFPSHTSAHGLERSVLELIKPFDGVRGGREGVRRHVESSRDSHKKHPEDSTTPCSAGYP